MTDSRDRARSLFLNALEIAAEGERAAYVEAECGGDDELRREVGQLLDHAQRLGRFMEGGEKTGNATIDQPITETAGTVIDRYKLLEQIGEGGFGVVFMAEQEEPVRRKVALKIIKPGMDTKEVIARFEAERQALAIMDHPNIAKVFDAGATGSGKGVGSHLPERPEGCFAQMTPDPFSAGRPYFVMELVRGIPITDFCDQNSLSPRERLELFASVCQAVQHAHQKGIIHRDIKPSNVMVTLRDDTPVAKVIDFGVAKATNARLTEKTLFTRFGQMIGTPLYMSPEQAGMSELDIDTRSDIYSLGVLLYELLTGATPFDRQRIRQAAYDELLKIIREEEPPKPSLRISSLGETLPSVAAQRKLQPKKLSALVRGELDWIVMKALEKDRTRRYETATSFAADIQRYLDDEPVEACPPSAAYRFKKFARRNKASLAATLVVLMFAMTIAGGVGWFARDRAAREARVAVQVELAMDEVDRLSQRQKWPEALAAAKRAEALLATEAHAETDKRVRQVLADLQFVQRLERARLLEGQMNEGDFDRAGAERAYALAFADEGITVEGLPAAAAAKQLRTRRRILGELAVALTDWARLRRMITEGTDDTSWQDLLEIADEIDPDPWRGRMRAAWKTEDSKANALRELADSADVLKLHPSNIVLLGRLVFHRVSPAEAAKLLGRAQEQYPGDFWINFHLACTLHKLTPKRLEEAVVFFHVALALKPGNPVVLGNLGDLLVEQGKPDEAIACYQKAVDIEPEYAPTHNNLGVALRDNRDLEGAIREYNKAIELDSEFAEAHYNLGLALSENGDLEGAIREYNKAIELDPEDAMAHNNLGVALRDNRDLGGAIRQYNKAIELDPEDAATHSNLGNALREQGDLEGAIRELNKAIELDPGFVGPHTNLGNALRKQGDLEGGIRELNKAVEVGPQFAVTHYNLGLALRDNSDLVGAIRAFNKAIELDPEFAAAHNNLGATLKEQGRLEGAIEAYRAALKLIPDDAGMLNNLAWYLATATDGELRNPQEALQLAGRAVQIDPERWEKWNTLSVAAF